LQAAFLIAAAPERFARRLSGAAFWTSHFLYKE
jgi:hypothetical protein